MLGPITDRPTAENVMDASLLIVTDFINIKGGVAIPGIIGALMHIASEMGCEDLLQSSFRNAILTLDELKRDREESTQ